MKALISRADSLGRMSEVGTTNRTVVSHYKTLNGVRRYAHAYANGRAYRIEFYADGQFYGKPFRTEEVKAHTCNR